jgi:hypothetical protein
MDRSATMEINSLAGEYGIFSPDELKFMNSVFDEVHSAQKLVEPWQDTALARQILYIFQNGERDRDVLVNTVNGYFRRPRLVRGKRWNNKPKRN